MLKGKYETTQDYQKVLDIFEKLPANDNFRLSVMTLYGTIDVSKDNIIKTVLSTFEFYKNKNYITANGDTIIDDAFPSNFSFEYNCKEINAVFLIPIE